MPPEALEALVSPIALFPDPLLGQVLEASLRPQEVADAAAFLKANPRLTGKDLESALKGKPWDDSVKALAALPDVLKMLSEHTDWARDLGNGVPAAEGLGALRRPADARTGDGGREPQVLLAADGEGGAGAGEQRRLGETTTIIYIEPAQPQVVYVPVYSPTVVYGTWAYPMYPPPPVYPPGYVAGVAVISFSIGVAIGSSSYWRYPPYPRVPAATAVPSASSTARRLGRWVPSTACRRWRRTVPPPSGWRRLREVAEHRRRAQQLRTGAGAPSTRPAPSTGVSSGRWRSAAAAAAPVDRGGAGAGAPSTRPAPSPSLRRGDRGWGGGAPAAKPAPSGYGGMGAGSQTKAASNRGSSSLGSSGRSGGGGGRRR